MTNPFSRKIRVLIADDHQVVREGLTSVLEGKGEFEVVGLAADGNEAIAMARKLSLDVVLMDISMPNMNGVEATRQIKKENPQIGIVVLTMYADEEYIFDLVRAGAAGYLLKDADSTQIAKAIKAVARGESMIHPTIASKILTEFSQLSSDKELKNQKNAHAEDELSEREITVLMLLAEGKSNKEIANELKLSDKTVKNHLHNIFLKLNVTDRTKAVISAIRKGLIDIK
ncbi:MAG: response regulator transcription factor [Deltaproteobacteria bacterium]|nr:response regulator transcription factor [Deltaproteobacteria bacterium]